MTTTDLLTQRLSSLSWSSARVELIAHFLLGLIRFKTVNLVELANHFETASKTDSNYKRLQRFFRHFTLDYDALAALIAKWLPNEPWILCLDRTNWKIGITNVNILVLAVAYKGIAVPLLWSFLDKQGNSNTAERIELMGRFLKLFGYEKIAYLTGDREFKGKEWLSYLKMEKIPFRIRITYNTRVENRARNTVFAVSRLFPIRVGETMVLNKPRKVWGMSVFIGATRTKDDYVIIISDIYTKDILKDYARRWEIETLFGCLKTKGFNLEETRMRERERLSKLFALLSLAFIWSYRTGEWRAEVKPIRRLKHGRLAHSLFRYGLDYLSHVLMKPVQQAVAEFELVFQLLAEKIE